MHIANYLYYREQAYGYIDVVLLYAGGKFTAVQLRNAIRYAAVCLACTERSVTQLSRKCYRLCNLY